MTTPIPADSECYRIMVGPARTTGDDFPNEEAALAWAQENIGSYSLPLSVVKIATAVIQVVSSQVTVTTQTAAQARGDQ